MIDALGWERLQEWKAFSELEPFGEERADFRSAQVTQALWNIARDQKAHPKGWPLEEFLLKFGDYPRPEPVVQTLAYQEMVIDAWCGVQNILVEAEAAKCRPTSE